MIANKMIELLQILVPKEGVIQNMIPGVDLFRITKSTPRTPQAYYPGIIILAQGQKKIFIGEEVIVYDPMNYLVLSVPLPLECETTASADEPLLGITLKVDIAKIGEILLSMKDHQKDVTTMPQGIYASLLNPSLTDAVIRLLEALSSKSDRNFLGPMIVREILYRVLLDEKGDGLRALALQNQRFFQIAQILNKIHESYQKRFDLSTLAREAGMSASAFHSSFKAVTHNSPLQYIKNIKLHKARLLMTEGKINATEAALQVGYESPSQFNREYKRLFGITPGKDAIFLK